MRSSLEMPRPGSAEASPVEDAALVGLVREGEPGALEELYLRYGRPCYGLALRILGDPALAQDVVQEVFLALWRDARRFDPARGVFATWLLSMTHHKAVDVVRREENLRRRKTAVELEQATAPAPETPHEAAWTGFRRERVREAMRRLPAAQRDALRLAYYGGYTQREIAGMTGTPLGTVKTRTLAALRKLREVLDDVADERAAGLGGGAP